MSTKSETVRRPEDTFRDMYDNAPKFDLDSYVGMHRTNLETFAEAQRVMLDFAQTMTRRQADLMKDMLDRMGGFARNADAKDRPQAYVDEFKSALERTVADMKETMDLGLKAQNEVVDLFVKQAGRNFDEVKGRLAA
ncbi:MAG: phasin family protein [Geminicoccaceae bacterium]|nr:phasin family protein [Geminicoccaceae bacterium]